MNFIEAMVEMLKQPKIADRIFGLARTVKSNPDAPGILVHIFQEDLKAYLPCYYDKATGAPKSRAELEAFHLKQRWEIGGKSLSILHPLEQTKEEMHVTKPKPPSRLPFDSQEDTPVLKRRNTVPYLSPLTSRQSSSLFATNSEYEAESIKQHNQDHVPYRMTPDV